MMTYETKQQMFDAVARHLLTQNARATNEVGECFYRSPDGKKCAVGALIPDESYTPAMEGRSLSGLRAHFPDALPWAMDLDPLADRLQVLHDTAAPERWRLSLRGIAEFRKLDTAVLDEVK